MFTIVLFYGNIYKRKNVKKRANYKCLLKNIWKL